MAATWTVAKCETFLTGPESAGPLEGHENVIFRLHWECTEDVIEGDEVFRVREFGAVGLRPFEGGDFIAWGDVTEEQALTWLHERMGADEVSRIESNVALCVDRRIHPTTETGVPW